MSKNNRTAVILTLLIILGLFSLAGAIALVALKMQTHSSPNSVASSNSTEPQNLATASDRNVDYSKLKEALQQQNWKAADRETYERLLEAAGPKAQAQGFIPEDEMETLSCKDLTTVDRLWSNASNGKFGFSSQQGILRALGDYRKMYEQVGWQRQSGEWQIEWNYNPQTKRMEYKPGREPNFTNPPSGHFPTVERGYNFDVSLDAALKRCKF